MILVIYISYMGNECALISYSSMSFFYLTTCKGVTVLACCAVYFYYSLNPLVVCIIMFGQPLGLSSMDYMYMLHRNSQEYIEK